MEFGRVLQAMKRGEPLTLTYRNRPLARIVPVGSAGLSGDEDDPLSRLPDHAEPLGDLSNVEIDRALYGGS